MDFAAKVFRTAVLPVSMLCMFSAGAETPEAPSESLAPQITITSSSPHIVRDSAFAIDAEIKNTSSRTIAVLPGTIQLELQPEVAPGQITCPWFYYAAYNDELYDSSLNAGIAPSQRYIVLHPQESLPLAFSPAGSVEPAYRKDCTSTQLKHFSKLFNFAPGVYAFQVSGAYYVEGTFTKPNGQASPWSDQHIFSKSSLFEVQLEQFSIVLLSGLGGILAYLIMALRPGGDIDLASNAERPANMWPWYFYTKQTLSVAKNLLGAGFLCACVTVVASRLSDTEFPIKVSVNDFWGALTVGFVSYFIGNKFIDKLADLTAKPAPVPVPPKPVPPRPAQAGDAPV